MRRGAAAEPYPGRMDPDDLLAGPAVEAAVAALAERNHHHLEQMSDAERADALEHWRELAITVLTAARSALQHGDYELSIALANQADKVGTTIPTWMQPWNDSPAKVRRDAQVARSKTNTGPTLVPMAPESKKEPTEKQKAQQARMKDCNKRASDKKMKGDERKQFMSACLKG